MPGIMGVLVMEGCVKTDIKYVERGGFIFVNLTSHEITIFSDEGIELFKIPPSGKLIRVNVRQHRAFDIAGVPVNFSKFSEVRGVEILEELERMFDKDKQVVAVMSTIAQQAIRQMNINTSVIIVSPDTTPQSAVRDENGQIIGVRAFQIV